MWQSIAALCVETDYIDALHTHAVSFSLCVCVCVCVCPGVYCTRPLCADTACTVGGNCGRTRPSAGTIDLSNEAAAATTQEVEHVVVGQVLVGAEGARKRLEALLRQRKLLLGEV